MDKLSEYLKGRGLFVFSDPGGAKPVLALVNSLISELTDYIIISDREYSFYSEFDLKVQSPTDSIEKELEKFRPDFIFTGTSYTSKIELEYISAGKERRIPIYSFVDHWTNIRERFKDNENEIFPDKICVIDQRAKKIGMQQGLESSLFLVTGNPFQDYLRTWQPQISKEQFFKNLGIEVGTKKIIVFAPDPLSNVKGKLKFGFDEIEVIDEINKLLNEVSKKAFFIFKPHPNQKMSPLNPEFLKKVFIAEQSINNNCLIYYSDFIIGFFSNYLIEADIMKKTVLRYLPEYNRNDPMANAHIGSIVNKNSLLTFLNNQKQ